jgi:exonuclease III
MILLLMFLFAVFLLFNFKSVSWNCYGLKSSLYDITQLCQTYDLILLQEHWLRADELHMINSIHSDFIGQGVSAMNTEECIISGRPYGGVCVLWRKSLAKYISVQCFDDDRIIGCTVNIGGMSMQFINVYMPYQCDDNYDSYIHYFILGKLNALKDECKTSRIVAVGDFNAKVDTKFESELLKFVNSCHMKISDYAEFGRLSDVFTYVSDSHGTTSWLDHYISSHFAQSMISDLAVLNKVPSSDHLPLAATFQFICDGDNLIGNSPVENSTNKTASVSSWSRCSANEIAAFREQSRSLLSKVDIPTEALLCNDTQCDSIQHRNALDTMYQNICKALYKTGLSTVPSAACHKSSHYIVPGWNEYVRESHHEARESYIAWRDSGKPRQGPLNDLMRTTRLRFKYNHRQCISREETACADGLANSLSSKDLVSFWKSIKKMNTKSVPLASTIEGFTGDNNICDFWATHYHDLLNCVHNVNDKPFVNDQCNNAFLHGRISISPSDVMGALNSLKKGKTVGHDFLAAEHYIHAHDSLAVLLSLLFSSFMLHGHLSNLLLKTIIVPLVKNKTADLNDKSNYRPIALVTASSKILELILLEIIDKHISTSDNQFGFKKHLGTDMCIYTLKNVVEYYRSRNSTVLTCFLDASKAFDRVNHWCLFKKLLKRGVPSLVVRLLCFWYATQTFCVKWGSATSVPFSTKNGVRQGGILSPRLFTLYMDDLSHKLNSINAGCYIGSCCVNHLFYADDICLLAPSALGLQQLLDVC